MVLHKRLSIFKRLIDGPAYQNYLADEVDASQSTIYRGLKQLEDHNLVKKTGWYVCADNVRQNNLYTV
ncbi:helix-turn-helix domain-containing protein [Natronobacterium texcoconense]|nr:winged helix-turn-helix domain-containing protein [Natronobacterium texcoconense]